MMNISDLKNNKKLSMLLKCLVQAVVFAVVLIIDQCTKAAASNALASKPGHRTEFIPGIIDFYYSENTGASFSIFQDHPTVLTVITAIALSALLIYIIVANRNKLLIKIPLILILGGGIGNLIDRFRFGAVRDFIYFIPTDFAIFNLADSAITIGSFILIAYLLISIFKESKQRKTDATGKTATENDAVGAGTANTDYQPDGADLESAQEESAEIADGVNAASADGTGNGTDADGQ
ncbi:MAG: signal peptidase II [Clostridiaceae bacterium]|jgi:signal peptidase II|nr:signal peptidase II [Clostridiaceae bacterium]